MNDAKAWPTELRLATGKDRLTVAFDDGAGFVLPAELLRVLSPSAEVQGHAPSERRTQAGKRQVRILAIEPIGNYAIRLVFDDRHETGIYSWDYLRRLGRDQDALWKDYLADLDAKGLSRDP